MLLGAERKKTVFAMLSLTRFHRKKPSHVGGVRQGTADRDGLSSASKIGREPAEHQASEATVVIESVKQEVVVDRVVGRLLIHAQHRPRGACRYADLGGPFRWSNSALSIQPTLLPFRGFVMT